MIDRLERKMIFAFIALVIIFWATFTLTWKHASIVDAQRNESYQQGYLDGAHAGRIIAAEIGKPEKRVGSLVVLSGLYDVAKSKELEYDRSVRQANEDDAIAEKRATEIKSFGVKP